MGLLYNLQQEYDDEERKFIEQSKPYIEFLDLLQSIADFTNDTPHMVAKFLYNDGEILNLISYDLDFLPLDNECGRNYYPCNAECDNEGISVSYSEWFFRMFLDFDNIREFQDELEYDDYCFFKKTDILTLDCLKRVGFVDLSLLRETNELEILKRQILEKDKIIENLIKAIPNNSQLDNKELTATSQKSVTKLLYALLKEHNYELGATKGATNDTLFNLCESHNAKLSRETIAKWLDKVNDLEK